MTDFGYGAADADFIDYDIMDPKRIERIFGERFRVRMPSTLRSPKIVFLGAAQTFGRFVASPYPAILGKRLDVSILNISRPGSAPATWLNCEEFFKIANRADIVIYQILSARGTETSFARSESGGKMLIRKKDGALISAELFLQELLQKNPNCAIDYVNEIRSNYVRDTRKLLEKITTPVVGFWFSKRMPKYKFKRGHPRGGMLGAFPQYVDDHVMEEISELFADTVYCISSSGLPQVLVARDGSDRRRENNYYPSPLMHIEAANALEPVCRKYVRAY